MKSDINSNFSEKMKRYYTSILFLLMAVTANLYSQELSKDSQKLKEQLAKRISDRQEKINEYIRKNPSVNANVTTSSDGAIMQLFDIENGIPIYRSIYNENSAKTIGTNLVRSGEGLGFDLDGTNAPTIGIWDGGDIRETHRELRGRVTDRDGVSPLSSGSHATHVAGTMIASGIDPDVMGMAPNARIDAYDWNNDITEMANANLLLSNHSYGLIRGWDSGVWFGDRNVSTVEDYQFGRYNRNAQEWDAIAKANNKYLIIIAAGNHRDDIGPIGSVQEPDGDWDCIADYCLSKNVFTVGAVADIVDGYSGPSSVRSAIFSSWGPVDDGRIKPDIVANGVWLKSTDNVSDTALKFDSGTSMAAPSVTGSLALLYELEREMPAEIDGWSSTFKGLVIHSADEAGTSDGPDYSFGWGLMNTARAAEIIRYNNSGCDYRAPNVTTWGLLKNIYEVQVNKNQVTEFKVHKLEGKPLKVTIAWVDPAGTVGVRALDDRTPSLVNNIDLRIISPNGNVFFPWKLDPANPASAATKGDNNVDNIEQIVIEDIPSGTYTVQLNMDSGSTDEFESVSLIVTGNDRLIQNLTVTSASSFDKLISNGESEYYKVRNSFEIDSDYVIEEGGEASFHGSKIVIKPGFRSEKGSSLVMSTELNCDALPERIVNSTENNSGAKFVEENIDNVDNITKPEDVLSDLINVYPNPTKDFVNISFDTNLLDNVNKITITSMQGRIIMEKSSQIQKIETMNLSSLEKGVYVVNVILNNGTNKTRLVIKN